MELPILFEDDTMVAIDKPSGVMTHPDGKSGEETVSDWFAARYPASKEVGETQRLQDGTEIRRPGVVHRLDRETSGVLVLAKTPEAHAFLKEAFHNRLVKKNYYAFVYGVPKEKKGTIEFSIGRSRQDFRLRSAQPKAKGTLRDALTRYEVVAEDSENKYALLICSPETGRTHQIRVHLKAIHHPVLGDPLYAPNRTHTLGFSRLGLHSFELILPTPEGDTRSIQAPLPEGLKTAAEALGYVVA